MAKPPLSNRAIAGLLALSLLLFFVIIMGPGGLGAGLAHLW